MYQEALELLTIQSLNSQVSVSNNLPFLVWCIPTICWNFAGKVQYVELQGSVRQHMQELDAFRSVTIAGIGSKCRGVQKGMQSVTDSIFSGKPV